MDNDIVSIPSSPTSPIVSFSVSSNKWTVIVSERDMVDIKQMITSQLPKSHAYQTTDDRIKFHFCKHTIAHMLKRLYRKCKLGNACQVKYRVDECMKRQVDNISSTNTHEHEVEKNYDNSNGTDRKYKIINDIMQHNIDIYPKQIMSYIINNKAKLKLSVIRRLLKPKATSIDNERSCTQQATRFLT